MDAINAIIDFYEDTGKDEVSAEARAELAAAEELARAAQPFCKKDTGRMHDETTYVMGVTVAEIKQLAAALEKYDKRRMNMKTIVVKWIEEKEFGYGQIMRVIASDHPRFSVGSRFDFGFFETATRDGYKIVSLAMEDPNTESGASDD